MRLLTAALPGLSRMSSASSLGRRLLRRGLLLTAALLLTLRHALLVRGELLGGEEDLDGLAVGAGLEAIGLPFGGEEDLRATTATATALATGAGLTRLSLTARASAWTSRGRIPLVTIISVVAVITAVVAAAGRVRVLRWEIGRVLIVGRIAHGASRCARALPELVASGRRRFRVWGRSASGE